MEEIELRDALRHHVQEGEPPMALTAAGLIDKARTRNRFRLGASVGSGAAVAAITVLVALNLAPIGGGGPAALSGSDCVFPLALNYLPGPSHTPDAPRGSLPPDYPTQEPGTPNPTEPAHTGSDDPVAPPTATNAHDLPLITPDATAYPSEEPTPTPVLVQNVAGAEKQHQLYCYLAKTLRERLPDARFAQSSHVGPFEVYGSTSNLAANGVIIDPTGIVQVWLLLDRQGEGPHDLSLENFGWRRVDSDAGIFLILEQPDMIQMCLFTGDTEISLFATRGVLSVEDYMQLLSGAEMDVFK